MSPSTRFACALPFVLSACSFSVDPSLVRDGGLPETDDVGDGEVAAPPDAVDFDAGRSGDGSVVTGQAPDGETRAPDTQIDSGPLPCRRDSDCAADEFCSTSENSRCSERCTDERGCAELAVSARTLVSDDRYVYWSTNDDTSKLLAWDGSHSPFVISTEPKWANVLFAVDGTLYFTVSDELRRVVVRAGSTSERLSGSLRNTWYTPQYVYWTASRAGKQELWRVARTGGVSELVHTESGVVYIGGDDERVYRWEQRTGVSGSMLVEDDLATFSQHRDLYAGRYAAVYDRADPKQHATRLGDSLYVSDTEFPQRPLQLNLTTLDVTYLPPLLDPETVWFAEGTRWIYIHGVNTIPGIGGNDTSTFVVERVAQADAAERDPLISLPLSSSGLGVGGGVTVFGSLLVYSLEGHLFTKPITQ